MENQDNANDGVEPRVEPVYSISDLQNYIKESCLVDKCGFLLDSEIRCFLGLLKGQLSLDELSTLFAATSMAYFLKTSPENFDRRSYLLMKTFRYSDTLDPMHLHIAVKRMWNALKMDDIKFVLNVLKICHLIAFASETGRAISICLMWTILNGINETPLRMHSFQKFSTLIQIVKDIDDEKLKLEEFTIIIHILVQAIGFLTNVIVLNENKVLKKAGYRPYFSFTRSDLKQLIHGSEHLKDTLSLAVVKNKSLKSLHMVEYINSNIIGALQDNTTFGIKLYNNFLN